MSSLPNGYVTDWCIFEFAGFVVSVQNLLSSSFLFNVQWYDRVSNINLKGTRKVENTLVIAPKRSMKKGNFVSKLQKILFAALGSITLNPFWLKMRAIIIRMFLYRLRKFLMKRKNFTKFMWVVSLVDLCGKRKRHRRMIFFITLTPRNPSLLTS